MKHIKRLRLTQHLIKISSLYLVMLMVMSCTSPEVPVERLSFEFGTCLGEVSTPNSCANNLLGDVSVGEVGCWIIQGQNRQPNQAPKRFSSRMLWDGQSMSLAMPINQTSFPFQAGESVSMALFVFDSETTSSLCSQIELNRSCEYTPGCWSKLSRSNLTLTFNEPIGFHNEMNQCFISAPTFSSEELCDRLDNDCDGVEDEGEGCRLPDCLNGEVLTCNLGCGDGVRRCMDGQYGSCMAPEIEPEQCDDLDNDCDGKVDEGVRNACGQCEVTPVEVCDGIDNDCDEVIDELVANCCEGAEVRVCGSSVGLCTQGVQRCEGGSWTICDGQLRDVEQCDGADNDCDGSTDEDLLNACGVCGPTPAEECNGVDDDCDGRQDEGVLNDCGQCGAAPVERCDGIDNDCDGDIDEGVVNACGQCGAEPIESCDGMDNDCDGDVDEGLLNACGQCGVVPGEICGNGVDDDCDGGIDEGLLNACNLCGELPMEVCDGMDNDCDGDTDEGVLNLCGQCGLVPAEICDGIDNDCDGDIDEEFSQLGTCDFGGPSCLVPGVEECRGRDGIICVNAEPIPGEICDDQIDNDCDGDVDEDCPDCGTELCDGMDNDCDGEVDEESVCGELIYRQCTLRLGWVYSPTEINDQSYLQWPPVGTGPTCPANQEVNQDTYSCDDARFGSGFRGISLSEEVNLEGDENHEKHWLGLSWDCQIEENSPALHGRLLAWVRDRCHAVLGYGQDAGQAMSELDPAGCGTYSSASEEEVRCMRTGEGGAYSILELQGEVDETHDFGIAFYCEEVLQYQMVLNQIQNEFTVFFGIDQESNAGNRTLDGSATLGQLPELNGDFGGDQRGVGSNERGSFSIFNLRRELKDGHKFFVYTSVR